MAEYENTTPISEGDGKEDKYGNPLTPDQIREQRDATVVKNTDVETNVEVEIVGEVNETLISDDDVSYVGPQVEEPVDNPVKPTTRPKKPRDCPECVWDGKQWVRPAVVDKLEPIESGSGYDSKIVTPGKDEVKLYKTTSCPCSCYAILDNNGELGCEKEEFGTKVYIKPTRVLNHTINGLTPRFGDRWRCAGDLDCQQDGFKWDTLHVVRVEENTFDISTSLVDSMVSTSKCYVPRMLINEYSKTNVNQLQYGVFNTGENNYINPITGEVEIDETPHDLFEALEISSDHIKEKIDGTPLFPTKNQAVAWESFIGGNTNRYTEFYDNGVTKYLPGQKPLNNKEIFTVTINGKNALRENIKADFNYDKKESECGNLIIDSKNSEIVIKMVSTNTCIVDISITDSSDCDVTVSKLKQIKVKGEYVYKQKIKNLPSGKSKEVYTVKITPSADTAFFSYDHDVPFVGTPLKYYVYQYADPTYTVQASSSSISNASTSTTAITQKGKPNRYFDKLPNYTSLTHTVTVSRSSGSDNYYLKPNAYFRDAITDNVVGKKQIVGRSVPIELGECINDFSVAPAESPDGTTVYTDVDIERGMRIEGTTQTTKEIVKVIDIEEHLKDPCDDCDKELEVLTNKVELTDTFDLFPGMLVEGVDSRGLDFYTEILEVSTDCITFTTQHLFQKQNILTFTYTAGSSVYDIKGEIVQLTSCLKLPKKTVLDFYKCNKPKISGTTRIDKSGATTVILTTTIDDIYFNGEDATFEIDTDSFITNKPNACDQNIKTAKDTDLYINFVRCDSDYNKHSKTATITQEPKHGSTSAVSVRVGGEDSTVNYYKKYTPNAGYTGLDKIKFTLSDGANTSDEKTIFLTIK